MKMILERGNSFDNLRPGGECRQARCDILLLTSYGPQFQIFKLHTATQIFVSRVIYGDP